MKREHKYRGFIRTSELGNVVNEMVYHPPSILFGWLEEGSDLFDMEIMQWTGLKDKNGKDIYEGDIMMCYHDDYYDDGSDRFVTVIDFVDGSFWSINEDCCSPEDCEVIGNIYENPELLQTA